MRRSSTFRLTFRCVDHDLAHHVEDALGELPRRVAYKFQRKWGQKWTSVGTISAVSKPFSPIARAAKAPAISSNEIAWAAPIPLPAVPAAKPNARQSVIFAHRNNDWIEMATRTPPAIARPAASEGIPPTVWVTSIAMGVVTALGATESAAARLPPQISTRAIPPMAETSEPAVKARAIPGRLRLRCPRLRTRGTASATVAGPSRKWINCAPAK